MNVNELEMLTMTRMHRDFRDYSPEQCVERGMALLDEEAPGWEDLIDLNRLHIASASRCVLAQTVAKHQVFQDRVRRYYGGMAFADFGIADAYLRGRNPDFETSAHGFCASMFADYYELDNAWRAAILARREENKKAKEAAPKQTDYVLTA